MLGIGPRATNNHAERGRTGHEDFLDGDAQVPHGHPPDRAMEDGYSPALGNAT